MRTLLVTSELAPWSGGGGGVAAAHLALALRGAGHDVTLLTLAPEDEAGGPARATSLGGVPVVWADGRRGVAGLKTYPCRPMREAMALHLAASELHGRGPFEVIEFADFGGQGYFALRARDTLGAYGGAVLAVRVHSPAFVSHEVNGTAETSRARMTIEHMERDALGRAEVITAPSRAALERVLAGLSLRAAEHTGVVPNAWSAEAERVLEEAAGGAGPEAVSGSVALRAQVVCVGRLEWQKGQDVLVRALAALRAGGREVAAALVGRETRLNPQGRAMREVLREAGAREADFAGARSREGVRGLVEGAEALAAPSRWDNMPYAVIEAMARGKAVVVSSAGGMPELVRDGIDGVVVDGESPEAWSAALAGLLEDPERRAALGASARQRVADLCEPGRVAGAWVGAMSGRRGERPESMRMPQAEFGGEVADESVEVVIPHFEMPHLLEETLASIAAQSVAPERTIVVDDGSRDGASAAVLARLEGEGVRVIRQENQGPGAARRAGLLAARARFVMFVDADERLHPSLIEKCLEAMRRGDGLTYVSPLVRTFDEGGMREEGWVPLGPDRELLWAVNVGGAASGTLFDRARLTAMDAIDPGAPGYEDWDMFCTIAERGGRGEIIPEFLLEHRLRAGSREQRDRARHSEIVAWVRERHRGLATARGLALAGWMASRAGGRAHP